MKRYIALCVTLTSCGMYNSSFDCPPGRGIGCKSVNEVLNLIVEREEGEDLLVADAERALLLREEKRGERQEAAEEGSTLYLLRERSGKPVLVPNPGAAS